MQFKHPEILYALLLLIIPIIVHLFQLQKFTKVPFTNVKLLREIQQQNRKSSRIKKWLVLASRLLAFAALIIAFAQPYISNYNQNTTFKTTVYLDNSFSMQAKGEHGELLKYTAQNIVDNLADSDKKIHFFTNNQSVEKLTIPSFKNALKKVDYSANSTDFNSILLQLNTIKTEENESAKNILISDFQNANFDDNSFSVKTPTYLVKVTPNSSNNLYIDSVFISERINKEITLNVVVKSNKPSETSIPISLFNNETLIGKSTVNFNNTTSQTIQFSVSNQENYKGKIVINDANLSFDNQFFFTLNKPNKVSVLCIGKNADFLSKIYTKEQFNYEVFNLKNLDFNSISNADLIVLNELESIPQVLTDKLFEFFNNGGKITVIPSNNIEIKSYNAYFKKFNTGQIIDKVDLPHKVTSINYNHPIFNNVFEKKVDNFDFPYLNSYFETDFKRNNSIVKMENSKPFISSFDTENSHLYWVASPLNKATSNFINSPLIVPVFYNMAISDNNQSNLYYKIKPTNTINVNAEFGKNDILSISNGTDKFIPLQQMHNKHISLQVEDQIQKAGFYTILNNEKELKTIAFNYATEESILKNNDLSSIQNKNSLVSISNSVNEVLNEISNEQKINTLFKWFLAFSALFLCIEMLILKYFKI